LRTSTSPAFGGATSISSSDRGWPASQATAARAFIAIPLEWNNMKSDYNPRRTTLSNSGSGFTCDFDPTATVGPSQELPYLGLQCRTGEGALQFLDDGSDRVAAVTARQNFMGAGIER